MYLLAIETTGAYASVALLQGMDAPAAMKEDSKAASDEKTEFGPCKVLGVIHGNDRFSHLQNLTPQIDRILKEASVAIQDLTAVAVSHGPGSFTGIRIGVSTARALGQVLDIPCVAVSSLEALALRALERAGTDLRAEEQAGDPQQAKAPGARRLICPALDARRKQVYGGAYELADGKLVCRIAPASCLMTEFLQKLDSLAEDPDGRKTEYFFLGDGIDTCGGLIEAWAQDGGKKVLCAPGEIRYQDAASVALRGYQLWQAGESCGYMDLQPEYLRMAEAEKKLREKMAASGQPLQDKPDGNGR